VEDHIVDTLIKWITDIGKNRIARRKAEEESRRKAEQERIRREQEPELKRRQDELEQQQKQEREKVDSLFREANAWQQSKVIRDYLQTVEKLALERSGSIEEGNELSQWLQWARRQADRLDPLTPSPPSILDQQI
jgi:hypothetical protein